MKLRNPLPVIILLSACNAIAELEAPRLFEPAPRDESGAFTNPIGDLSQGTLGVRVPFMLRRFGTYFRGNEGAPLLMRPMGACAISRNLSRNCCTPKLL